ncbi:MAG: DUF1643 domain-containing protein, partial [bacterium]
GAGGTFQVANPSRVRSGGRAGRRAFRAVRCVPPDSGPYRYLLEIVLSPSPGPSLAVILKNPSRASAERSDPTVGKLEAWARWRGFGRLAVVNLFARRGARPEALNEAGYRAAVGPGNDRCIRAAARGADRVAAGWGNPNGIDPEAYDRRIGEVLRLLGAIPLHIVGEPTRQGHPRHGLHWNSGLEMARRRPKGDWGEG